MSENVKDRFGRECFVFKAWLLPVDGFSLENVEKLYSIFNEIAAKDGSSPPAKEEKRVCMHEDVKSQRNHDLFVFHIDNFNNRKSLQWYCEENAKLHSYDYTDSDGNLYCGICKEIKADKHDNKFECKCMRAVYDSFKRYRYKVFGNSTSVKHEFQYADMKSDFMRKCEKYADRFETDSGKQFSLLLFGDVGRGKTYAAACITNRLIDRGFSVMFTSVSKFERGLWADDVDKSEVYDSLTEPDLLVIDDLASERDTDYMHEIQFNMLQTRLESEKPMIITTNLTAKQLTSPDDLRMARINSRILENSYALLCDGVDRRLEKFKDNSEYYEQLLSKQTDSEHAELTAPNEAINATDGNAIF